MKINKSFLNEGTPSKSNFNEANNENKHEDNNNLLSVPQENYQDATISIVNEESNKALENSSTFINPVANKLYSPSNSQYQGDGPDRLSSFLDNSFSQKRKSPIEKFGKVEILFL